MRLVTIVLVVISARLLAQQTTPDSVRADSLKKVKLKFVPTGIRVGTDVIAFVKTARQNNFSGSEYNADIDFYKYLLAFDYGNWARNYGNDSASYNNDGRYWRAGVDINFLTKDVDRNVFFIGMRYARSTFNEQLSIIPKDDRWGLPSSYTNNNVKARWLELTGGIKVKVWKFIWMGYTARFKFGLKTKGDGNLISHDVPGYGRTFKDSTWGFNYQIFVRLPFRKADPIMPNKKKK